MSEVLVPLGLLAVFAALWVWLVYFPHVRSVKPGGIIARLSKPVHDDLDDTYHLNAGQCPDCHASGSLLQGPRGGASQNIGCEWCLSEFNIGIFPDGLRVLDRMGKLSVQRAQRYGISPEEHERAVARNARQ